MGTEIVRDEGFMGLLGVVGYWTIAFGTAPFTLTGGLLAFGWWFCILDVIIFPKEDWYDNGGKQWMSCGLNPWVRAFFDLAQFWPEFITQSQIHLFAEKGSGYEE